jgi:hypothetical protein
VQNPFVDDETRQMLRIHISSALTCASATAHFDFDSTGEYLMLHGVSLSAMAGHGDSVSGAFACLYEVAQAIGGNAVTEDVNKLTFECDNPECSKNHEVEAAYLAASLEKNYDGARNFCNALVKEANRTEKDPHMELCSLYAVALGALVSAGAR